MSDMISFVIRKSKIPMKYSVTEPNIKQAVN